MGGLVSSYYAENMAQHSIRRIITLGSPLQGTELSILGVGKSAEDLTIHSPFIQKFLSQLQHSKISYIHLASLIDNFIVPTKHALPPYLHRDNIILKDHGHLRLLISPAVIQAILPYLI